MFEVQPVPLDGAAGVAQLRETARRAKAFAVAAWAQAGYRRLDNAEARLRAEDIAARTAISIDQSRARRDDLKDVRRLTRCVVLVRGRPIPHGPLRPRAESWFPAAG